MSFYKVGKEENERKKMNEIIYPVFQQITDFIKQIKEEVQNIEKSETKQNFNNIDNEEGENNNGLNTSTTQPHPNARKIKMETGEKETICGCSCNFSLPDCLKKILGK